MDANNTLVSVRTFLFPLVYSSPLWLHELPGDGILFRLGLTVGMRSQVFNTYQGKGSVRSAACTGDCIAAKICYIRSASAPIAKQNCIQGFGSVQ